jgi:uncharacterized protein YndB with AHSA1/START domain
LGAVQTGVRRDGAAFAVRLEVEYAAPAADVWDAMTRPDRLARWLATPHGTMRAGHTIILAFGASANAALRIDECEPRTRVSGGWAAPTGEVTTLRVDLAPAGPGRTGVTLDHGGLPAEQVAEYGCGWQYHVDALAAELTGTDMPDFAGYYPAGRPEWEAKVADARG